MGRKRKVTYQGNTFYVGAKIPLDKCPKRCVRDGKLCAYRIKMTGMSGINSSQNACGYMYYTGQIRDCNDPDVCSKWAESLAKEIMMSLWDEIKDGDIYDE